MRIDFTPLVRGSFIKLAERTDSWATESSRMQIEVLRGLLSRGGGCEYLRKYVVTDLKGHLTRCMSVSSHASPWLSMRQSVHT